LNVTYDNLLYLPAGGASELDANGIVLYNQAGPQSETYFDVWTSASNGNPLPDNFYNTVTGSNANLGNPFTVSPNAATPEPGYGLLALGLLGLVVAARRRKNRLV
jgi:MYXO-CTERM domain-containing protein